MVKVATIATGDCTMFKIVSISSVMLKCDTEKNRTNDCQMTSEQC